MQLIIPLLQAFVHGLLQTYFLIVTASQAATVVKWSKKISDVPWIMSELKRCLMIFF